jgi:hypothetical protein
MEDNLEEMALKHLIQKESESGLEYDDIPEIQEQPKSLGKASFVEEMEQTSLAMESPWKKIPLTNLPSTGFGYPPETEITIRSAEVGEIRHFSTIDENDPIDIDDKINHIISKCCVMRWKEGILNFMDIYQEDRFYLFMSIRDLTFVKGENRIFIPVQKTCEKEECPIPPEIELTSAILSNFKLDENLKKYYDSENGCFQLTPKNGDPGIQLFIPTIGVSQKIRKILRGKVNAGKKYDVAFANMSAFIIPNWRDLTESSYDEYERISKTWTYTQFVLADTISKQITFATKNTLSVQCSKCSAEVTAPIRFRGGIRSLYIVSDIFGQLL